VLREVSHVQVYFVMGLAERGDLRALIHSKDCPSHRVLLQIARDSIKGLAFLHG
jgi:hypothetical protein